MSFTLLIISRRPVHTRSTPESPVQSQASQVSNLREIPELNTKKMSTCHTPWQRLIHFLLPIFPLVIFHKTSVYYFCFKTLSNKKFRHWLFLKKKTLTEGVFLPDVFCPPSASVLWSGLRGRPGTEQCLQPEFLQLSLAFGEHNITSEHRWHNTDTKINITQKRSIIQITNIIHTLKFIIRVQEHVIIL